MILGVYVKTSRRDFLKVGLLGSAVLLAGSSLSAFSLVKSNKNDLQHFSFLNSVDTQLLLALAPIILKANYPGMLGKEAEQRLLISIDNQISSLGQHSQTQLQQLFDLLGSSTLRYFAGAPSRDWYLASNDQIESFLEGWKNSMFALKRTGYAALCKLITMSWYTQPENFSQASYPGPPKIYPPQE
jgi:hypothetical protein